MESKQSHYQPQQSQVSLSALDTDDTDVVSAAALILIALYAM